VLERAAAPASQKAPAQRLFLALGLVSGLSAMGAVTSDDVNFLVYRYLQESGAQQSPGFKASLTRVAHAAPAPAPD